MKHEFTIKWEDGSTMQANSILEFITLLENHFWKEKIAENWTCYHQSIEKETQK